MDIRLLTTEQDLRRYDAWVETHPQSNLWQSLEWKRFQEALGRETPIYAAEVCGDIVASALVVMDRTIGGFSTWEIPRGPFWTEDEAAKALMQCLIADAKTDRCLQFLYSPIRVVPFSILNSQFSIRHVFPAATRMLDLTKTEAEILAQMHPKGRYNIGVAERHGVVVETRDSRVSTTESDIDAFYALLQSTAERDRFTVSQKSHYTRFLTDLDGSFILMAKYQGKPIAGLIGVIWPPPSPLGSLCKIPITPRNMTRGKEGKEPLKNRLMRGSKPKFRDTYRHTLSEILAKLTKQEAFFRGSLAPLPPIRQAQGKRGEGNVSHQRIGIYYYGASSYEHRQLMAPYLLQWEAMKLCKASGCEKYDLLGISASDSPEDPWGGISDFKRKFGGRIVTYPPEQMIVLKPLVHCALRWKRKVLG